MSNEPHILVIDDKPQIRRALKTILGARHFRVSLAVPYYGVGIFLPIMAMGLSIRQRILKTAVGRQRLWGGLGASLAAGLAAVIFVGQVVGKWEEGGWMVLLTLGALILVAHAVLVSPIGARDPQQIHRIIREKSQVHGPMGNIVEWQSLRTQEYRYLLLVKLSQLAAIFGIRRPTRFDPPVQAGAYDDAILPDAQTHTSLLTQYLSAQPAPQPQLGGRPAETSVPAP